MDSVRGDGDDRYSVKAKEVDSVRINVRVRVRVRIKKGPRDSLMGAEELEMVGQSPVIGWLGKDDIKVG